MSKALKALKARLQPATLPATPVPPAIHTPLTIDDVDTIGACHYRVLNAVVLLELGLQHMDSEEVISDPESIQAALLDVVSRLREDATMIDVTMKLAAQRHTDGAQ